ncbi:MarC family protein [Chachezhania antarctica]|uniref:MarC family protein n=1 Tax=Chachezhania antarctica TaxID=2340860 RepID=UPI0013CEC44A|nr:MarC family protein [Chachezhania antarctica]
MNQQLQALATIISLVNPVVCVMIFSGLVAGKPRAAAFREATAAMAIVAFVLTIAALFGTNVLKAFGISLDAFSVAGGAVLMFIGFSMLAGGSSSPSGDTADEDPGLGKLVLFAASPGTMTGVITIATAHSRDGFPVTALVSIAVVCVFTWGLLMVASVKGPGDGKPSLRREMASRYMGLIIVAMGIQFALTGYKAFMAA